MKKHSIRNSALFLIVLTLAFSAADAQWRQLPVPAVFGKIGARADGALYVLANGTLCISDTSRTTWTYQVFPYDINEQLYGLFNSEPPRDMIVASADTVIFISSIGDVYSIVRGEQSIHSASEGLKWKIRFNGAPFLIKNRGSDGEILLCHDDLYQTTNCGVSWDLRLKHPKQGYSFNNGAIETGNGDVIYLYETSCNSTEIYKSTDGGRTLDKAYSNNRRDFADDMLACPDGQIYAGRLFSPDSGRTWSPYSMPWDVVYADINSRYIYSIMDSGIYALNRANGLFFRKLDDPVFRATSLSSTSYGWIERERPGFDMAYDSVSGNIYAVIGDSLYWYRAGMQLPLTAGLYAPETTALQSYNAEGDTLLLCATSNFLRSSDRGASWTSFPFILGSAGPPLYLQFSRTSKSLLYSHFPDLGMIDIIQNDTIAGKGIHDNSRMRLVYDPFSEGTFYGGYNYLWKLTDSAVIQASKGRIQAERVDVSQPFSILRSMAFDLLRKGVMFLGGEDRDNLPFLYRSDDCGANWEKITSIPLRFPPLEILPDPSTPERLLVVDQSGVYISADDGATWTSVDPGNGKRKIVCIASDPDDFKRLYLGVLSPPRLEPIPQSRDEGGGVWESRDGGLTWKKLPIEGLFNYNITHVKAFRNPRRLCVGTACGVYEYLLDSTSSVIPPAPRTMGFALMQNFPNPCSDRTAIEYTLKSESFVRIHIHDALGGTVRRFSEPNKLPGRYRYEVGTEGLANGIYRYIMETRSGIQSRLMIVAR